ncbi:MAG: hypothetical protein QOH12_2128 [Solirubrobacteraceae bacterium]|nr:hypothetical protein [Solirubrobacteraceae bacterium]
MQGCEDNPYAVVYRDPIDKLPIDTGLVILTHEGWPPTCERGWERRTNNVVVVTGDLPGFSAWAQDG